MYSWLSSNEVEESFIEEHNIQKVRQNIKQDRQCLCNNTATLQAISGTECTIRWSFQLSAFELALQCKCCSRLQ
ncbi:hypothetical protein AMELA_G00014680, partial [Ameiurus melas]